MENKHKVDINILQMLTISQSLLFTDTSELLDVFKMNGLTELMRKLTQVMNLGALRGYWKKN